MSRKSILIFLISVAFFTLAAGYRFHDSAHVMGTIKAGGGKVRHPALLDRDLNNYMLIATAVVMPPYHGNARVVLEGDPALRATFHNSQPALDLGVYRHPAFRDNTYLDLRPKDRIALWIKITRDRPTARQPGVDAASRQAGNGISPSCTQCEPEVNGSETAIRHTKIPQNRSQYSEKNAKPGTAWIDRNRNLDSGPGRQGTGPGTRLRGPAVTFYDTASNEPLLKIPIRFTVGAGGGGNDH